MVTFFLKLNYFVGTGGWTGYLRIEKVSFYIKSFLWLCCKNINMDTRNKELHVFVGTIKV